MAQTMFIPQFLALVTLLLSSLSVVTSMDHHNFGYSMKCVPIPSEQEYQLELLESIHKGVVASYQAALSEECTPLKGSSRC